MPRTLHAELARAAEREGTSLNQLIVGRLSRSVGGTAAHSGDEQPIRVGEIQGADGSRGLRIALLVNLAVVALAAAVAVTLLVLAWRHGF